MQQLGLPDPQALVAELQRFNQNFESISSALNKLAEASGSVTAALKEASATGEKLYDRLWGG